MSVIVIINEGVCLGRGRGQFSAGVVLVIKRFHRESDILVDPTHDQHTDKVVISPSILYAASQYVTVVNCVVQNFYW